MSKHTFTYRKDGGKVVVGVEVGAVVGYFTKFSVAWLSTQ